MFLGKRWTQNKAGVSAFRIIRPRGRYVLGGQDKIPKEMLMKRVLRWVCCAALCVLALSEAGWANDKKEGQTFTQKQPEN